MISSEFAWARKWDGRPGWNEAYFLTMTDPSSDLGAWFRLTIDSPRLRNHPAQVVQWVILSQPHRAGVIAHRVALPAVHWQNVPTGIHVGSMAFRADGTHGVIGQASRAVSWDLAWEVPRQPIAFFPHAWMYRAPWPATKYAIPGPGLRCNGWIHVESRRYDLCQAPAHLGHTWGQQMATRWAWAQASHFDGAPGYFEALSAVVPLGPAVSPPLTLVRLHVGNTVYYFDQVTRWLRHHSRWDRQQWALEAVQASYRLRATITVGDRPVAGVTYVDPAGGRRYCYNTVSANGHIELAVRDGPRWRTVHQLSASRTTAYEHVGPNPDPLLPLHL